MLAQYTLKIMLCDGACPCPPQVRSFAAEQLYVLCLSADDEGARTTPRAAVSSSLFLTQVIDWLID